MDFTGEDLPGSDCAEPRQQRHGVRILLKDGQGTSLQNRLWEGMFTPKVEPQGCLFVVRLYAAACHAVIASRWRRKRYKLLLPSSSQYSLYLSTTNLGAPLKRRDDGKRTILIVASISICQLIYGHAKRDFAFPPGGVM